MIMLGLRATFCWCLTVGVCEDAVKRFVGWNRIWNPARDCWAYAQTLSGVTIQGNLYCAAEEVAFTVGGREVRGFDVFAAGAGQ